MMVPVFFIATLDAENQYAGVSFTAPTVNKPNLWTLWEGNVEGDIDANGAGVLMLLFTIQFN